MDKYYKEIKDKLIDDEIYAKTKDYSKERHKVITYFETGKLLYEAGNEYGKSIIDNYSKKLINEVGKKYDKRTLYRMRKLYKVFSDSKVSALLTLLSWSHYLEVLTIKNTDELIFYINLAVNKRLNYRQLHEKIKNKEYERLDEKTKEKIINDDNLELIDTVKNPILIKNSYNIDIDNISEKFLQRLILEDISGFMNELGDGFCFIKEEYPIKIGDRYNYIDLLLFNIKYNCYVVVELKVTELKKEHIGQIEFYMNYIDENIKTVNQNKTIGILIVKENNKFVIKYKTNEGIVSREYQLV